MDNKVVVIGGGGHAKVVISVLRLCGYQPVVVLDDFEALWGTNLLGVPVRGPISSADPKSYDKGIIAVGRNDARQELAAHFKLSWVTVVHPTAWVDASVELGAGTVVFAGAMIQPGTVIGEHAIVNTGATIDHDCQIGNFVHVAPGVHLAGNVTLGEGSFMGIAAAAIPGVQIGEWTIVGAGGIVIDNLPARAVAYGVPARPRSATK